MPLRLTQETLIPLGVAGVLLSAVAIASWRIGVSYSDIEKRLDGIEKKLNEGAAQNVNERDFRLWIMTLKERNKALDVPELFR